MKNLMILKKWRQKEEEDFSDVEVDGQESLYGGQY